MNIIFYASMLILRVGWCTCDENFVIKTVGIREEVTLSCSRNPAGKVGTYFWIRFVAGKLPEILGRGFSFDNDILSRHSRITAKQEPGRFVLHITETKQSDTAFYYCFKSEGHHVTFLKGAFLRIQGPKPDSPAVIQDSPSGAVHTGDVVTLQCSVLSESQRKTCPEEQSVYWLKFASGESHPSLIHAQSNSDGKCDMSPEAQSVQRCVYSFIQENFSSSDAGNYYCAACGMIVFGNGTKLDIGVARTCDPEKNNSYFFVICGSLAISLTVVAALVCVIRKNVCYCCKASVSLQAKTEIVSGEQENRQELNQECTIYSEDIFIRRKANKAGRRNVQLKEETIYSDVRV